MSTDALLGLPFNLIQVYFLLETMAKLTGLKPGIAKLRMVNIHIYEDQYEVLMETKQHLREPYTGAKLKCNKPITYESVFGIGPEEEHLHPNDFEVIDYQHHPAIKYPFSV